MTRTMKLILGTVIALFLVALIWVIVVAVRQPKKEQAKTSQNTTPTLVGEPTSTTQNPATAQLTPPAPKPVESVKPRPRPIRTIIIEEEIFETIDGGAWASASTGNGSSSASAFAN